MVLELLVNPKKISGKRWEIFLIGIVYSFISVFLALWIFESYASLVMITLTIIASIPLMHKIIEIEEKKDMKSSTEPALLKEHSKAITSMMYLFLGFLVSFSILYLALPEGSIQNAFGIQIDTISQIVQNSPTGNFSSLGKFNFIFINNLKILMMCIAFSFLYGAGAIFILTWNASVMAAAIGSFIKNNLLGDGGMINYLHITTMSMTRYMIHGIPEIAAYFIGALASGILSFAIINHDFESPRFKKILGDASELVLIAVIVLFAAALIEVYITPILI